MGFVHWSWRWLDANIASLRALVIFLRIMNNFKHEKRPFVETQCLRLTNAKTSALNLIAIKLFDSLDQRTPLPLRFS
jgi:hypothetical protein